MRRIALAVAVSAVLAACSADRADSHLVTGTKQPASNQVGASRALRSISSIAAFPDRGDLVNYTRDAPVQKGASTWHAVELSEARAIRAIAEGGMVVSSPDGHPITLRYTKHVEHENGNWTWIGRPEGAKPGTEALLTFGPKAVFGSIPTGTGLPMQIATQGGRTWMVTGNASLMSEPSLAGDAVAEPAALQASLTGNPPSGISETVSGRSQGAAVSAKTAAASASSTATTVDLVVGYTNGFATRLGGASQALTRLQFIVDVANQAYANSQVSTQLRLVNALQVNYADNTINRTALFDLSGVTCTNATGAGQLHLPDRDVNCTPTSTSAALQPLLQAREKYRADLVSLVRIYTNPDNQSCGVAWLLGGGQQGVDANSAKYALSVISDSSGMQFPSNNSTCRDETLVHELGHNMGLAHDRTAAQGSDDTNGDGNLLDPEEYGRFPYSFGYSTDASGGNFYTIMAVPTAGQTSFRLFSNPRVTTCNSLPCGVGNVSDNALSLTLTLPIIAAFREPTLARFSGDFDGDGKSDLLWRNTSDGRNNIWLAGNSATQQPIASVTSQGWTIVGVGDFNGDGRSDILWRNTQDGRNTIWLSGNNATQQAVAGVTTQTWVVRAVADFNGDHKADILWRNTADGRDTIWLSGSNATQQSVVTVTEASWRIVGAGDFNGDGKADILWRNSDTGGNAIWLSANHSTQQPVMVADLPWEAVGIADFNGDSKADILWRNRLDGRASIWLSGSNATQQAMVGVTELAWRIVGVGDFDGDHKADVVWRNLRDGRDTIWLAANNATQQATSTVPSQAWGVVPSFW